MSDPQTQSCRKEITFKSVNITVYKSRNRNHKFRGLPANKTTEIIQCLVFFSLYVLHTGVHM